MAHSPHVKANALAMLMLGDSPRYVAEQTGVPLTTVKRWRNIDMKIWLREIFPRGVSWGLNKMALKKEI
jgi:hypothetical protein